MKKTKKTSKTAYPWYTDYYLFVILGYSILLLLLLPLLAGCVSKKEPSGEGVTTIVFKHGKIAGDPALFRKLIDRFEARNPDIKVKDETLPASTDEQHQFYVINLEGKSSDFDVLSMDVIWVPEFARTGWLKDLSTLIPEDKRDEFFPGPMQAVTYKGSVYAVPWYIDAGLLYYRKDLLEKYGFPPPKTWQELVKTARSIMEKEPQVYGFIWQGKQYEGLVCNVLEYFWSNGGDVLRNGRVVINSPENVEALQFMVDLIRKYKVTPPLVVTAIEEPTRHIFGSGRALFMRNWPYAWNIFQREGSAVRGKIGVSRLPSFPGKSSASTLGGWQLGINRYSKNPRAAERFVKFLTSPESQKTLALTIGYKPTRKSLYRDADLIAQQPFIASLYDIFMTARPRPVTPYYMLITQVMQPEFSAALSGIKTPEDALKTARIQIERILGAE
ncbi:Maltodextrin ABC transporter, substrate-binding protein MdxE [hydrothermal vent metagenome]|uniref:Maltodextrin ABC transporter, substrate-binding protein MdxE n=1 Tax=hydrothermal vent metagenome TaxID=652676 RepID=A0A3B1CD93_9ZZZZ